MKIDKVVFSVSDTPDYAPFWNIQAKIFRRCLNIEPVCLVMPNTDKPASERIDIGTLSQEHGRVITISHDTSLPWLPQLTWSKFDYPRMEPDTTWLIGDIDLIPLSKFHFHEMLADVPDTAWCNLNAGGISACRIGSQDGFMQLGSERHGKDRGNNPPGTDIPAHYHVAKGHMFELLARGPVGGSDTVRHIVESGRYGLGVMTNEPPARRTENPFWYYWCAEEHYSSWTMYELIKAGRLDFRPFYYDNGNNQQRVQRDNYDNGTNDYTYLEERARSGQFVDVHCARPYAKQEAALNRLVKLAWNI